MHYIPPHLSAQEKSQNPKREKNLQESAQQNWELWACGKWSTTDLCVTVGLIMLNAFVVFSLERLMLRDHGGPNKILRVNNNFLSAKFWEPLLMGWWSLRKTSLGKAQLAIIVQPAHLPAAYLNILHSRATAIHCWTWEHTWFIRQVVCYSSWDAQPKCITTFHWLGTAVKAPEEDDFPAGLATGPAPLDKSAMTFPAGLARHCIMAESGQ